VAREFPATSASVHGRFEPGTKLGTRYRIVGLLGRGGMGEVYRADDLELGQSVALKFLPEKVAGDPTAMDRFRGEVRNARKIAHPNVCRMYDIGEVDGHVFLSMEYIDGEDLAHVLARMGRPSEEKAIEIARQLCLGLAAAHENGVLHRDLKPANIMIDGRGRVRITDFGLAGLADELAGCRDRAGTPAYMAPEQLEDGKVSVRSDIFALGLVLHEVFTGRRAYDTNDVAELKRLHSSGSVTTPSSGTHEIDQAVERIIDRCLERDPQQRPQSVYAVLGALPGADPLAAALAAGETPSPELVANARDAGGLRPPIAIGLVVALLVSIAITHFIHAGTTVMPQRSPAVLSVVAEQIMEELGYVDLPNNSVSGYDVNRRLSESLRSSSLSYDELTELDWPPRYFYWRRWTDGTFIPDDFHFPEMFGASGLTKDSTKDATISLDSTGRLRGLVVTPSLSGAARTSVDAVDWSPVFRLAGLDVSGATVIPTVKPPKVHCDELVAWRIETPAEGGDPITFQMGAASGWPNYFEIILPDDSKTGPGRWGIIAGIAIQGMWVFVEVVIVFFAWRNLRSSRGDRRNAFRCALAVGALYAGLEVMSIRSSESTILDYFSKLSGGRAAGHILIHALNVWLVYMAIEPYVRRVWPRMLVGLVRLLSGRLRDPAVGREVLIGVVTGCGLVGFVTMLFYGDWRSEAQDFGWLPNWFSLYTAMSPGHFIAGRLHVAAWVVLDGFLIAGYMIVLLFVVRRVAVVMVLAVVLVGFQNTMFLGQEGLGASDWVFLAYWAVSGVAVVLLYTRVGILATIVCLFAARMGGIITTDFDTWFGPYAAANLVILLALASYGFWISLAGQPIFKDMLLTEKPARA
jgi:serine/threonine-protein kinase